jgi:hypothetical protein
MRFDAWRDPSGRLPETRRRGFIDPDWRHLPLRMFARPCVRRVASYATSFENTRRECQAPQWLWFFDMIAMPGMVPATGRVREQGEHPIFAGYQA